MHANRKEGFSRPERITFETLNHWQGATGIRLDPWERKAILAIEAVRLKVEAAASKPTESP